MAFSQNFQVVENRIEFFSPKSEHIPFVVEGRIQNFKLYLLPKTILLQNLTYFGFTKKIESSIVSFSFFF